MNDFFDCEKNRSVRRRMIIRSLWNQDHYTMLSHYLGCGSRIPPNRDRGRYSKNAKTALFKPASMVNLARFLGAKGVSL